MTVGSIPHLVKKFTRDARPGRFHPTAFPPSLGYRETRGNLEADGGARFSRRRRASERETCTRMLTTAEHVPHRPRNAGTARKVRKCHRPTPPRRYLGREGPIEADQ